MTEGKYYIHTGRFSTETEEQKYKRDADFEKSINKKINEGYIPLEMYTSKIDLDRRWDDFKLAMYLPPKPASLETITKLNLNRRESKNGGSYKTKSKKTKKLNKYM